MSHRTNGPALITPPTSGWSWYHQASSVATQVGKSLNIFTPKNASGDSIVGYYQVPPATPYTVIAHICNNPGAGVINNHGDALHLIGIAFSDGTGSLILNLRFSSTQTASWSVLYCANSTTGSANLGNNFQDASGFPWANVGWLMLRNDGTNIKFYVGDSSGKNFELLYSEAKGAHLGTINEIGLFSDAAGGTDLNWACDSWQVVGV